MQNMQGIRERALKKENSPSGQLLLLLAKYWPETDGLKPKGTSNL